MATRVRAVDSNTRRRLGTSLRLGVLLLACAVAASPAAARRKSILADLEQGVSTAFQPRPITVPATGTVEVAFSPNEGAEKLVVKVIDSAIVSIRMLTYTFTSAQVVGALIRAKKRGVDVALVVDYKNNLSDDRFGKARAALGAVSTAGIAVRTISTYPIHHDKMICVDNAHVETGSYNYSDAAARKNSENVIVLWNNPQLAALYLQHWERNWKQGERYTPAF